MQVDMEKQFTTTKSDTHRKYDEDFLDVHSLFPGVDPDLYSFDLSQTDELAAVGCNYETDEDHLGIEFPSISPIHEHNRSVELDSLKFLDLEEYANSTKASSRSKTDTANWPSFSSTSANTLVEASDAVREQQDGVHREHYRRADNLKFRDLQLTVTVDTPTHYEHQCPPTYDILSDHVHVGAYCQEDTSVVAVTKGKEGNHNIVMLATGKVRPEEPVPCPRCQSLNTKFCYYNNYNRNQPRHFCRSCKTQWTVGGNLRPRSPKSKDGQTARRRRNSSRMDVQNNRGSGTKESEEQVSSCGDLLKTGNGRGHPNKGRNQIKHPILAGDTQGSPLQQGGGRKRKDAYGPSSIHVPASELPLNRFNHSNASGHGEISTAAARNSSLSFSQLLRNNAVSFLPSLTANVVRVASGEQVAIQLAETPGISADVDEPGPGFQAFTPTAAAAPRSVSELGKEYGPVSVSSVHHLEDTSSGSTSFIPNDLHFEDVVSWSLSALLERGHDWMEMAITVTSDTNDSHSTMSENA